MSFEPGTVICANCHECEEEHCPACESCPHEPSKECCMEGWPEKVKEHERQHWATRADAPDPAHPEPEAGRNGGER